MTPEQIKLGFNRWMDDYTNRPDAFEAMSSTTLTHLKEKNGGEEPSYGEKCEALIRAYASDDYKAEPASEAILTLAA